MINKNFLSPIKDKEWFKNDFAAKKNNLNSHHWVGLVPICERNQLQIKTHYHDFSPVKFLALTNVDNIASEHS